MIKAIETRYAGCNFRSRLEARWAVFFDSLGIEWEYETERFALEKGSYLPDFYLPSSETWVEVKGDQKMLDWDYISRICDYQSPLPGVTDSLGSTRGLLILGPIPRVNKGRGWNHALIQHSKGLHLRHGLFIGRNNGDVPRGNPELLVYNGPARRYRIEGSKTIYGPPVHISCPEMLPRCGWDRFSFDSDPPEDVLRGHKNFGFSNDELSDAYENARSARFEHGQSGRT